MLTLRKLLTQRVFFVPMLSQKKVESLYPEEDRQWNLHVVAALDNWRYLSKWLWRWWNPASWFWSEGALRKRFKTTAKALNFAKAYGGDVRTGRFSATGGPNLSNTPK